ncbi:MAG: M50 family metallopeptidase [Chloroflexi bacterium]|nr:M50 family metallopeptidase [Chloroflexota bacterium]
MTILIGIIVFVLILGFIVIIHELGHLLTAKWRGVKVQEFGIGMPPRIFAFKKGETEYSLNWIPLGGFTKMPGELDPKEERGLSSKGYGSRLLILAAGSILNIIVPVILLIIAAVLPYPVAVGVKIYQITPVINNQETAAARAGLQAGDILLEANGEVLDSSDDFSRVINANENSSVDLNIERDGETINLTLAPPYILDNGKLKAGVVLTYADIVYERLPPLGGIRQGFRDYGEMISGTVRGLFDVFTGRTELNVVGPVGIAQATTEILQVGSLGLASIILRWVALISITIGIMNLLPIPVFDGGHILFILIEIARRGKKVSVKTRTYIQAAGVILLLLLAMFITYRDVLRIITGGSILP